jgi:hypothetical protein
MLKATMKLISTYLLNLELLEVRDAVYYDPGQRPAEVKELVDHEGHDTSGQNIVAHPCVPGQPHLLKVVELHIVLGDLLEGAPVGILRHWRQDGGGVPAIAVSTWR